VLLCRQLEVPSGNGSSLKDVGSSRIIMQGVRRGIACGGHLQQHVQSSEAAAAAPIDGCLYAEVRPLSTCRRGVTPRITEYLGEKGWGKMLGRDRLHAHECVAKP